MVVTDPELVGPDDVSYLGAFDVPASDGSGDMEGTFTYGGHALGYDPSTDSLFFGGHDWYQRLGQVSVPSDFSQPATVLQQLVDPTDGNSSLVDDSTLKLGGSLVFNDRLIVTMYSYYDADSTQALSHFASSLDLTSQADADGPFALEGSANARSKAGYMTTIPAEWQAAFGGPALTGNCCLSILGASSAGPAVSVFDPDDVGVIDPVPASTLLFYPLGNPTTADGTETNDLFIQSDAVVGVAFPAGSRSVLFVGTHGQGEYCYGPGTSDQSLHGTPDGEGNVYCYDLVSSAKGTHAYPYVHQVWAYDADELLEVLAGARESWEVVPYATFELSGIRDDGGATMAGATYDPDSGRLFVTERYGDNPRVHVFEISLDR